MNFNQMVVQAMCMLLAIAMVHSDNRRAAAIAMGLINFEIPREYV